MKPRPVEEQATKLLQKVEELAQVAGASGPDLPEELRHLAEEARTAMEELHVAEEELLQQNEELVAVRGALDEERRRYVDLFELAPDGYLVTDLRGLIREANRAAGALLGRPPERLIGKPLALFVAPNERRAFRAGLSQAANAVQPARSDFRAQPDRGKSFPASATVTVGRDAAGKPVGLRWLLRDVTEDKRVEEEREARFRGTFENAAVGIAHVSLAGRFLRVNNQLCEITDYSREELLERTFQDITHPEDLGEDLRQAERLRRGEIEHYTLEKRCIRKDGTLVWVQLHGSLLRDEAGEPLRFVAIVQDIGKRQRMEEELRRARDAAEAATRAKSQFLANMSHEIRTPLGGVLGMAQILGGTHLDWDQRQCVDAILLSGKLLLGIVNDVLDMSRIESGRLALESTEFSLRAAIQETVRLHSDAAFGKGLELACRVGRDVPARVVGDPGRLRQVLMNLVANAVKFTERGRVVVRSAVADERGTTAVVRFEVEDTGIGIPPEVRSTVFDPFAQVDASTTRRFGGSGLGLTICRRLIEAMGGAIGVQSEPGVGSTFWFTVPFLVAQAAEPPRPVNVRILVVAPQNLTRNFLLEQLDSLGVHAVAAEDGARAERQLAEAGRHPPVQAFLVDLDLPGEDPVSLARRLRQGSPESQVIFLGSSAAQTIDARRRAEGGASYLVKPVTERELASCLRAISEGGNCAPDSARATAAREVNRNGASRRILVAEDNRISQMVVRRLLEQEGYWIDVLENGADVVEAALRVPYDAILMDWQMPGMDGTEAAREIRRREAPGRRVPIIAMTAHALEGDREKCLDAGMDDYLTKPISGNELARALARWTGGPPPAPEADAETEGDDLAHTRRRLATLSAKMPADAVGRVVEAFLEALDRDPDSLQAALEGGDASELARDAHRFRGTCVILGTKRLADLTRALEAAAGESELAEARAILAEIRAEAGVVRDFLESVR